MSPAQLTADRPVPTGAPVRAPLGENTPPAGAAAAAELEQTIAAGLAHAHLRANLQRVLADLRYPAQRWQVVCEAEAWGVSDAVRRRLVALPEGGYPHLDAILRGVAAAGRRSAV